MGAAHGEAPANGAEAALTLRNKVGVWLGLILFAAIWFGPELDPQRPAVSDMMAIAVLMATWWVTEAIPIPATALLPIVLFPLTGIMKGAEVAREYMSWLILLFLGGFLITGFLVVLLAALANIFLAIPALSLAISAAVIMIMSGFILYDTSRMINGGETNYVLATIGLYLSIYNIFISLLHLLGALSGDD